MPVKSDGERLGGRLRLLREGAQLTQAQLADALGVAERLSASTISTWESGALAPKRRLLSYALLFSGDRFLEPDGARLPDEGELDRDEALRMSQLRDELLDLRQAAANSPERGRGVDGLDVWRFADGAPVTIVCSELPKGPRIKYADKDDPNFVGALGLGDLDALLDLYGAICARNPTSTVRRRGASELQTDEITDHLVVLGGVDVNEHMEWYAEQLDLHIEQLPAAGKSVGAIQAGEGGKWEQFRSRFVTFEEEGREKDRLVEDIGAFIRIANPHNPLRTLTFCFGIHTHGVRGAAQCFIDPGLRAGNLEYIDRRFGDLRHFELALSVRVRPGRTITPDLRKGGLLYAWPPPDPADAREVTANAGETAADVEEVAAADAQETAADARGVTVPA
jgi:transcriptional regulator with XRE-family HTH domain